MRALLQAGIAAVLGTCFRLMADAKNSDSVVTTAAATVRQARALQQPASQTSELQRVSLQGSGHERTGS